MKLVDKKCVPCEGGIPALTRDEIARWKPEIHADWQVLEDRRIRRELKFVNFLQTLDFVSEVGKVAEEEGHHPEILFGYGHCEIEIWTHAINGLSENDFILAAKIDRLL